MSDLGPVYTPGKRYRARAEERQREFRANVLGVGYGKYGHFLSQEAADAGSNFALLESFEDARERQKAGKGVAPRTFENMLSSQAMCFNIFSPLSHRLDLAAQVLRTFVPNLVEVKEMHLEYTPDNEVFGDQTGRGGVDCDLLVEGLTAEGEKMVLVVETKFVEPDFSSCGFRKPGRAKKGQAVCPETVEVRVNRNACLYQRNKNYRYWERSDQFDVLAEGAIPSAGCPFGGQHWQLWVNLLLAHAEAEKRSAKEVVFAVCASSQNTKLLGKGEVLDGFRALTRNPDGVKFIDLELLLDILGLVAPPELVDWAEYLKVRYQGI